MPEFGPVIGVPQQNYVKRRLSRLTLDQEVPLAVIRSAETGVQYFVVTSSRILGVDYEVRDLRFELLRSELVSLEPDHLGLCIATVATGESYQLRGFSTHDRDLLTNTVASSQVYECEPANSSLDLRRFSTDRKARRAGVQDAKGSGQWKVWKLEEMEARQLWAEDAKAAWDDIRATIRSGGDSQGSSGPASAGAPATMLADEIFARRRVRIFSDGTVTISGLFGGGSDRFEKLVSIEESGEVNKKSALGRGAAATLTMGASWLLTPDKRGDIYLTIVTDRETRVLHEDPPSNNGIKSAKKLAATGRSVISSPSATLPTPSPKRTDEAAAEGPRTVVQRLRQLNRLRDEGLISADEFEAKKAAILRDL